MAENKKSFILYADQIHSFENLDDDEAGRLIKLIFRYVNDQNPEPSDKITKIAFEPIKHQLKRDLKEWESQRKQRSEAGRRGGLKSAANRSEVKQSQAPLEIVKPTQANQAVNVNETVTVNVTDRERSPQTLPVTNAETEILASPIQFEQICMKTGMSLKTGKEALRKFHLHLASKDEYPKTKSSVFAGFEKWLMNEKAFQPKVVDLKNDQQTGPKLKTI